MPYSAYTLNSLITEVSNTLSDPGNIYWTTQEINYAVNEALHEWSSVTSYWRDRARFDVTPGTTWYDLSAVTTLRPRSITIDQIVREIQLHLLELPTGITGASMTPQFSVAAILNAVVRARNRYVMDSMMPYSVLSDLAVVSPPQGQVTLDQSVVYVHAAYWKDINGVYHALERSDVWAYNAINPDWPGNPSTPFNYSQVVDRPLTIQLNPVPLANGLLDVMVVQSAQLDTTNPATTLGIPDDFAHAIKYAAMADLMSVDAETSNPLIVQYCLQRYGTIVRAAQAHKALMNAQVNDRPVSICSLTSLDRGFNFWRNQTGLPILCAANYELLAFAPLPITTYSATVDVARSAVIPASLTDPIQLGREEIEVVIKYAQHYLSLKMGGNEFTQTFPLFDDFQTQAGQYNGQLNVQSRYLGSLLGASSKEMTYRPDAEVIDK